MSLLYELRRRARQIAPQVFLACLLGYFAYHSVQGERGFLAWLHLKDELAQTKAVRAELAQERAALEHRVGLLSAEHLDPDLLEERARLLLNYGREGDLVVLYPRAEKDSDSN